MRPSQRVLIGLLALVILLALPSLACTPCCGPCSNLFSSNLTSPCGQVAVSRDAALRLESKVRLIQGDVFALTITDEELTSWIALKLPEFQAANPDLPKIPVANPQVCFSNGKVYVTGKLTDPLQADFYLVVSVRVEANQVRLTMEQGNLGPLPMPSDILGSLGQSAEATINDPSFNVWFTRIQVLDRAIVVEGRIQAQ